MLKKGRGASQFSAASTHGWASVGRPRLSWPWVLARALAFWLPPSVLASDSDLEKTPGLLSTEGSGAALEAASIFSVSEQGEMVLLDLLRRVGGGGFSLGMKSCNLSNEGKRVRVKTRRGWVWNLNLRRKQFVVWLGQHRAEQNHHNLPFPQHHGVWTTASGLRASTGCTAFIRLRSLHAAESVRPFQNRQMLLFLQLAGQAATHLQVGQVLVGFVRSQMRRGAAHYAGWC